MSKLKLRDIVPAEHTVKIQQGELSVRPVSLRELASCLYRHPQILDLLDGGQVNTGAIFAKGPEFAGELIVLACDGDLEQDMAFVDAIVPGDQVKLLKVIIEASFPDGFSDFFGQRSAPSSASTSAPQVQDTSSDVVTDTSDPELERALSA